MGRFYYGDIQGKFWFGIQDSNDVENLVTINANTDYSWKACNCCAELDEDYCRQCYETKEQHIEAAIEDEEYEDKCLYYEECSHGYSLDKDTHYDELIENMKLLKNEIPEEIIKIFEKIEQNDNILDAFTGIFNDTHKPLNNIEIKNEQLNKLVARYTLGYQIEYCLQTRDTCNITCEF